jgi:hypothetical protein
VRRPTTVDPSGALLRDASPRSKRWLIALATLGVLVVLAICGYGAYLVMLDERNADATPAAKASAVPSVKPRDISSQAVDPQPLTEAELFPGKEVVPGPNEPPYQVLKTQTSKDCSVAATDELGALLVQLGCTQVVRGTLRSPNPSYLLTAGVFNLRDEAAAGGAHEAIKPSVEAQRGRFTGLIAGQGTEPILRAPTHLGWNVRGHFLVYCLIARADSKPIASDDPVAQQILDDIMQAHLRDTVIGARAVEKTQPTG